MRDKAVGTRTETVNGTGEQNETNKLAKNEATETGWSFLMPCEGGYGIDAIQENNKSGY